MLAMTTTRCDYRIWSWCSHMFRQVEATLEKQHVIETPYLPVLRNQSECRVLKAVGKQTGRLGVHAGGLAAGGFGGDGVEVHEPRLEERPRQRLQRLVHPPVQLDLVVQCAENAGD